MITALFIMALVALALTTCFWIVRHRRAFRTRLGALEQVVDAASAGNPADQRRIAVELARSNDPAIAGLWQEFDETLVASPDGMTLYNTVDADYYFNETSLAPGLVNNRLLAGVPALLTAVGVLGTFVGLWLGLRGLNTNTALGPDADTDQLLAGIETMIGGASIAFTTSACGVFLSILINAFEKRTERRVVKKVAKVQQAIDHLYVRLTPEQSLLSIRYSSEDSRQSLQELHERIGDRLQETVQSLAQDMQSSVSDAITTAMMPAMEKLVTTTTEQSSEVFGQLVDRFASSFTEIGTKQAAALDQSSTRLTDAISAVAARFDATAEASRRYAAELNARHADTLAELSRLRDALDASSKHLASTAEALGAAAPQIHSAATSLDGTLTLATSSLEKLESGIDDQAATLASLQERTTAVSGELLSAATTISEGTTKMRGQLDEIGTAQRDFQAGLRADAEAVAATLRAHVEALESQVSKWLSDYSADVERQIETRMGDWNTQSQDYANQMLAIAQALATVVDDLEVRVQASKVIDDADTLVRGAEAASRDRNA